MTERRGRASGPAEDSRPAESRPAGLGEKETKSLRTFLQGQPQIDEFRTAEYRSHAASIPAPDLHDSVLMIRQSAVFSHSPPSTPIIFAERENKRNPSPYFFAVPSKKMGTRLGGRIGKFARGAIRSDGRFRPAPNRDPYYFRVPRK